MLSVPSICNLVEHGSVIAHLRGGLSVPPQVEQHEYGEGSAVIPGGLFELIDSRSC